MTDQELRALVRDAVARHLGPRVSTPEPAAPGLPAPPFSRAAHPSHAVYIALVNNNDDACVIEPSVPCNHCNYCRSHGH